jgi:asparagine synthase (glutamine-hydrolysing)
MPFLDYRLVEFSAQIPPSLKLNILSEKYILKEIARPYLPPAVAARTKQAYRAPDSISFFCGEKLEYVDYLLSEHNLRRTGYFDPAAVAKLVKKCRGAGGPLVSTRDNMAAVGIITTLLVDHLFVSNFSVLNYYPFKTII